MIDWFVNFEHFSYELHNDTPYGLIPDSLDLVPLGDLILETFGGEWESEEKSEKASVHIRCIRGTDIPNVLEANYRDIPRSVTSKRARLQQNACSQETLSLRFQEAVQYSRLADCV